MIASSYPLWTFLVFLPFALVPFPAAAVAWLVAQLALVVLGLAVLAKTLDLGRASVRVLALLLLGSESLWFLVEGGNMTGFAFAAFALSVSAALRGRPALSGASLAFVLLKPQSFVVVALAMLAAFDPRRRLRFAAGGVAVAAALVAASLVVQPGWPLAWLGDVAELQGTTGSNATGWTLARELPGAVAVALLAGAPLVLLAWWLATHPPLDAIVAAATPISVFLAPHGWSHEHLYLFVPAAILLGRAERIGTNRWMACAVGLMVTLVVLPWALLLRPRQGETLEALVPLALFALALWIGTTTRRERAPAIVPLPPR